MRYDLTFQTDRDETKRYLGYQPGRTEESERVNQLLEQTIGAVKRVAKPAALVRTFPLAEHPGGGLQVVGGGLVLSSPDLIQLLRHSQRVSFLVATLGPDLDQLISDLLSQGEYTAAAIADAIGSDAAEQTVNQVNGHLHDEARSEGLHLTQRFSPGYGSVPLELQSDWAALLQAEQIGVRVTSRHLLVPRKSITAILGWHLGEACEAQPHKCERCNLTNCRLR